MHTIVDWINFLSFLHSIVIVSRGSRRLLTKTFLIRKICLCTIILVKRRIFIAFVDLRNVPNLYFRKRCASFSGLSRSRTSAFYYHKQFEKHSSQFLCPFLSQSLPLSLQSTLLCAGISFSTHCSPLYMCKNRLKQKLFLFYQRYQPSTRRILRRNVKSHKSMMLSTLKQMNKKQKNVEWMFTRFERVGFEWL